MPQGVEEVANSRHLNLPQMQWTSMRHMGMPMDMSCAREWPLIRTRVKRNTVGMSARNEVTIRRGGMVRRDISIVGLGIHIRNVRCRYIGLGRIRMGLWCVNIVCPWFFYNLTEMQFGIR